MDSLLSQARNASRDTRECRDTMDALPKGFGEDAFRRLHHQSGSMAEFYSYSEGVKRFQDDGNNHRVHQRLMYVLLSCHAGAPSKGQSFLTLAVEAFKVIPPIA